MTTPVTVTKHSHLAETVFFDILKVFAHIVLPLCGALYFAFAGALDLPSPEYVVGGIASATAALGTFIKANEVNYNTSDAKFDGVVNVIQTDAKKIYQLALKTDPNLIDQTEQLLLKVVKPSAPAPPAVTWEAPVAASPPEIQAPVTQTPSQ
jgi:hypothetical protein